MDLPVALAIMTSAMVDVDPFVVDEVFDTLRDNHHGSLTEHPYVGQDDPKAKVLGYLRRQGHIELAESPAIDRPLRFAVLK